MSDVVIRFDRVSKKYRLHQGWYFSLRDEAASLARRIFRGTRMSRDEFWALRDVSFDVRRGETIGLIGANGAGKSTTLKILSRVTVPSSGAVTVRGKVGALIEIGAGFHPELTGRENVYLNGAIMGMRRKELDAKFERIVGFAEIGRLLDTPIKYYSSGMVVRLGFAVAAHIDPEILLVDEVLAVGDAAFQAKCLNKLAELKEQRRTILLVSHTMPSILQHSTRVLWIDHGEVRAFGDPEGTVETYLGSVVDAPTRDRDTETDRGAGSSPIRIQKVRLLNGRRDDGGPLEHGERAVVEVAYEVTGAVRDPVVSITFHDVRSYLLGGLTTRLDGVKLDTAHGAGVVRLVLSPVILTRGAYTVGVAIYDHRIRQCLDMKPNAATFTVEGPGVASREISGHVVYPHSWEVDTADGTWDEE
jgi:ABC-type polysaccharide/polyol phosphate transport system ATPase subunit